MSTPLPRLVQRWPDSPRQASQSWRDVAAFEHRLNDLIIALQPSDTLPFLWAFSRSLGLLILRAAPTTHFSVGDLLWLVFETAKEKAKAGSRGER